MVLEEKVKFTEREIKILIDNPWVRERTNFLDRVVTRIPEIARVYRVSEERVKQAVLSFPQFASYDHERVVREGTEIYGDEERVKQAVLSFPQFAGLDHERVVREGTEIYGDEERVKKAVLSFPPFASYDHERVVREGTEIYGDEERVKKAVLSFPPFASLDHERVVREGTEIYGDEERVKKAVLSFPPFAGLDHERVVKQKIRLGSMASLEKKTIIEKILTNPVLTGYSAKRYIAAFDVGRALQNEGFEMNSDMLKIYFKFISKSPYVPENKRRRISQVKEGKEPPLLVAMRKSLRKLESTLA